MQKHALRRQSSDLHCPEVIVVFLRVDIQIHRQYIDFNHRYSVVT